MTRYFVGIGSNDNAEKNCELMIQALKNKFGNVLVSQLIRTPAVGIEAPDYFNAVACFESAIKPDELNRWCKKFEHQLGRDRQQALCCADLDILLAVDGDAAVSTDLVEEVYFRPLIRELIEAEIC